MKATFNRIVIIVICIFGSVLAQETDQASSTNNLDKLIPAGLQQIGGRVGNNVLLYTLNNFVNIAQVGNNNNAYITQTLANGKNANLASIIQGNNGNSASISQNGSGNINTITQLGSDNEANINIDGDNNSSNILQIGNKNYALQDINASNKNYNVIQLGNNNSFQRYDTGQSPKAYIVSQNGNGLHLIISHNSYTK